MVAVRNRVLALLRQREFGSGQAITLRFRQLAVWRDGLRTAGAVVRHASLGGY
jgi:hypothetical protein